jgi:hypothetical protein
LSYGLNVNLALQWSPYTFDKLQPGPSSSTSCPLSLFFLSARSRRPHRPCAKHLLPRAAFLRATCYPSTRAAAPHPALALSALLHVAPPSPRASMHAAGLPAAAPTHPCLLLGLKHILELPTNSLSPSRTCISTDFLFPEHYTSPEPRHCLGTPSTAAATTSHPRSSALAAPPRPTEAHKPAQFRSSALDRPDHYASELELPPPLGLAVVLTIYCLLAPAKCTISTTSSHGSSLITSPPPSGTPATGTPTPPISVRRQPAASALLFPNTGHPRDRRELLNLSPHFPLAAGEPPRRNLDATDRHPCVARPRTQLQGFESFQGPFCRKSVPPL